MTNHIFFYCLFCRYLDVIEQALACGETVLLENLQEKIDPVLDPLLGRNTIKRGRLVLKLQHYSLFALLYLETKMGETYISSMKPPRLKANVQLSKHSVSPKLFSIEPVTNQKHFRLTYGFSIVDTQVDMSATCPNASVV